MSTDWASLNKAGGPSISTWAEGLNRREQNRTEQKRTEQNRIEEKRT
jgi:hypothetical protein